MSTPATDPSAPARPSPASRYQGQYWAVAGVAFSAAALWMLPFILGPLGIVSGAMAMARGERRARWVIVLAVICLVGGLLINLIPDHILFSE